MIELNLDISDLEKEKINKDKDLKIQEQEKIEFYKIMSNIYQEQLQLILINEKQ